MNTIDDAKKELIQICEFDQGHDDVTRVKEILSKFPSLLSECLNKEKQYLLAYASEKNKVQLVKFLLDFPELIVNHRDKDGRTALHSASYKGNVEIIILLLSHRHIQVNLQTKSGSTAVYIASNRGHVEVVRALLSRTDIDINLKFNTGDTAVTICCKEKNADQNNKEIILNLLQNYITSKRLKFHIKSFLMFLIGLFSFVIQFPQTQSFITYWKSELTQMSEETIQITDVFLSHAWGVNDNNHRRVKEISDGLKSRGLLTWIDDQKIKKDLIEIRKAIKHTKLMLVFLTEDYVRKIESKDNYCKKEFFFGLNRLGESKMLVVILDEAMKDKKKWGDAIDFELGPFLSHNMFIFDHSILMKDEDRKMKKEEAIDDLLKKILDITNITLISRRNEYL